MRIAHFYAQTKNLGDQGAARGIQTILRTVQPDIIFDEFNIDHKPVDRKKIQHFNNAYDGLILGGGGLLYNLKKKASNFYFNISFKNYNRLNISKCFYAIGVNAEYNKNLRWEMTDKTKKSIKLFSQNTDFIGMRDLESVQFMQNLGITDTRLIPCPSMFLLYDLIYPQKTETFAINLTDRIKQTDILKNLLIWMKEYGIKIGIQPNLIVHNIAEDRTCIELAQSLKIDVFVPSSPENLMEFYKKQQFLIGMRGHSIIFATGAKIPMISLSYNVKCDSHMDMLGMSDYLIKPEQFGEKELLILKLDELLKNYINIQEQLKTKHEQFYKNNIEMAEDFLNHIKGGKSRN